MSIVDLEKYKALIKAERQLFFAPPYELVYQQFIKAAFDQQPTSYFHTHASEIVENLRDRCWDTYVPQEKDFTTKMLKVLTGTKDISTFSAEEALLWFFTTYPEHIYQLSLSNTQSRRSRAGKEFEAIIELLLLGADIPLDVQGNVGKSFFANKGLGKLVDIVSPGVAQFILNKRNTMLISAKTSLRERWQEVPEEMGRTGAREMFLVTLDKTASTEVLDALYEQNVQLVTTKAIKNDHYTNNSRVLTFEDLIQELKINALNWVNYNYSAENRSVAESVIEKQLQAHKKHAFVYKKYLERKNMLTA